MKFVSRAEWGAKDPIRPLTPISGTQGVKVHYEGSPVPSALLAGHGSCAPHMRALQESHLANTTEGYSDIAYSAVICPHGYVFEGRGAGIRCAANGNQALNMAHYAVCGMIGTEGVTEPTPEMISGIRDAVVWLRAAGVAGPEIKGHRDGYATNCPGDKLYALVQSGAFDPNGPEAPTPTTPPVPAAPAWPGEYFKLKTPMMHSIAITHWQQQMADRGWQIDVDGWYGPQSERVCRVFQAEKKLAADGIVGPLTWSAAWTAPVQ